MPKAKHKQMSYAEFCPWIDPKILRFLECFKFWDVRKNYVYKETFFNQKLTKP